MKIPFLDLRAQHDEIRAEINATIADIIDHSTFYGGPRVDQFEEEFAAYCGTAQAVACATGTDALKLSLMACGIGPGQEVITTPFTFIATAEAITLAGAEPAFVDIDRATFNLSPEMLERFLRENCRREGGSTVNRKTGRRIAAVLPVHLYGRPAAMEPILELSEAFGLRVIEDAAQAHGASATVHGQKKRAGALGEAGAFSFYPGKNLGGFGEGGAVTTDKEEMADKMRMWRNHGQSERYVHLSADGWNGRLDTLKCAILSLKLKRLDEWNEGRGRAARWYRERLAGHPRVLLPEEAEGYRHVYHLFVVRLEKRDRVRGFLEERGIGAGLHYPKPLHLQPAYADLGWTEGDFPEAEAAARTVLSLPMFPHLTEEQVDVVCSALKEAVD